MTERQNTQGYTRNAGKRWRREDLALLRMLARRGAPLRLISLKLGRPDAAIRSKASELGLSVHVGEAVVAPPPSRTLSRRKPALAPNARPVDFDLKQMDLFAAA
ncbi:hypothetical protein NHF40_10485 [Maricaulaceae bacterium EIL42A08]|nr:hypothetical protein [Maricaulaceae bacterium EIL42A08]